MHAVMQSEHRRVAVAYPNGLPVLTDIIVATSKGGPKADKMFNDAMAKHGGNAVRCMGSGP